MQKIIIIILSVFTFFSCEQEIQFSTNYIGDVLVLNAKVLSHRIDVNLSHTADISGEVYLDSLRVSDGKILLFQGSEQLGVFANTGEGNYELANINLDENVDYYLKASAPGFEPVQSNTFSLLPEPATPVINAKQIENTYGNPDIDLVLITVDMQDKEVGENYYLFRVLGVKDGIEFPGLETWYFGDLYDICDIGNYVYGKSEVVIMPDKCFESDTFSLGLATEIEGIVYDWQQDDYVNVSYDTLIVEFGLIDKSFFDFIKTQEQPEGIEAGLVEPYYNYSAIQGGYGQVFTSNIKSWEVTW